MRKTRDLFRRRKWQPTPVSLPGESPEWTTVHGVAKGQKKKQKILRRAGKNTQKKYTKKILIT